MSKDGGAAISASSGEPSEVTTPSGHQSQDGSADDYDDLAIEKELESDVSKALSVQYLENVKSMNRVFAAFEQTDLEDLADIMSVLEFDPGETVVEKGEDATFFAIILAGVFNAKVSETLTVPLGKGLVLGEMAYFEGGERNADVIAYTKGIIAVFTYEAMNQLAQNGLGVLMAKLITLLAKSSIRKLQNTQKGSKAADEDDTKEAKPAKKEALFRNRKKVGKIAVETNKGQENQALIEKQKAKIAVAEHKARTFELQMQREMRVLRQNQQKAEAVLAAERKKLKDMKKDNDALVAEMATLRRKHRDDMMEQMKMLEETTEKHKVAMKEQKAIQDDNELNIRKHLNASQRQHERAMTQIASTEKELQDKFEAERKELQRRYEAEMKYLKHQINMLEEERDAATAELNSPEVLKRKVHDQLMDEAQKQADDRFNKEQAEKNRLDGELAAIRVKHDQLLNWKRSAFDHANRMQAEKRRMKLEISVGAAARDHMESYKTILKYFAVSTYVQEYRMRTQLQGLHCKIMKLLSTLINANEKADQLQLQSEIDIWMENGLRLQKLDKKAKTSDLVRSLLDAEEVLKCSVHQSNQLKNHWKATANRFFERNSVLKHDCMSMREALKSSMNESHVLIKTSKTRQHQIEVLSTRLVRSMEEGQQRESLMAKRQRKLKADQVKRSGLLGTLRPMPFGPNSSFALDRLAGKDAHDNMQRYLEYDGGQVGDMSQDQRNISRPVTGGMNRPYSDMGMYPPMRPQSANGMQPTMQHFPPPPSSYSPAPGMFVSGPQAH